MKFPYNVKLTNNLHETLQSKDCREESIADFQQEKHNVGLTKVLDSHRQHVQKNQYENCDFKAT